MKLHPTINDKTDSYTIDYGPGFHLFAFSNLLVHKLGEEEIYELCGWQQYL